MVILLLNYILRWSFPCHRIDFYHVGCAFHALLPFPMGFWLFKREEMESCVFDSGFILLAVCSFKSSFLLKILWGRLFKVLHEWDRWRETQCLWKKMDQVNTEQCLHAQISMLAFGFFKALCEVVATGSVSKALHDWQGLLSCYWMHKGALFRSKHRL